jgi:hypothetical protein
MIVKMESQKRVRHCPDSIYESVIEEGLLVMRDLKRTG